jgi:hypothetical protein
METFSDHGKNVLNIKLGSN